MSKNKAPIGIFDSGIGGLTVASAIKRVLPNESFVYFGDTAHLPYGDKSPESIRSYSRRIAEFLIDKQCKIIVIACNTASAHAFKEVQSHVKIPVVNVIDPVASLIAHRYKQGSIGIIGTKGTIATRVYPKRIQKLNPALTVKSLATPLLAPMIEEGYFNNAISKTIIHSYLSKPALKGIKALVLGCTHYPMIKKEVADFYRNAAVDIIDGSQVAAEAVKAILKEHKLLRKTSHKEKDHFYVSDFTASFEKSTRDFFGSRINLNEARIWD